MGLLSHKKFLKTFKGALITTGTPPMCSLQPFVKNYIKNQHLPVLSVETSSTETMKLIEQFTPKMKSNDSDRINSVVQHYEPHIDFDALINTVMRSVRPSATSSS